MKRILLVFLVIAAIVAPTAPAAEPATPKNAAQWCKAWRAGAPSALPQLSTLFGAGSYTTLFATKTKGGKEKKNVFGRCVSLTAKKLAAARQSADGATAATSTLGDRCRADRAAADPKYGNLGQCISDGGSKLATPN